MTAHSTQVTDAAQLLYDAQSSAIPIQPLTRMYPNLDVAQAYSVQRRNLTRYIDGGAVLRGHKIGLTSAPMQQLLGVNEPTFGYVLDSMMLPNGAAVPVTAFCAPRVEPEVAFAWSSTPHPRARTSSIGKRCATTAYECSTSRQPLSGRSASR